MMRRGRYCAHRPTVPGKVPVSLDSKLEKMRDKMRVNGHPDVSKVDLLDAIATKMERNMLVWEKDLGELLTVPGIRFGSRFKRRT